MKLFTILANLNGMHEAVQNPGKAGREYVWGVVQGYLVMWGIWFVIVAAFFGVLGFSDILGGPYLAFEILLYIWIFLAVAVIALASWLWRYLKNKWHQFRQDISARQAEKVKVIEVEYLEK